ncbi:MAG: tetratricopeptide repeat protein [Nitrosopumilus sp.]|nr:tetratricopeptide repeat protein [Nitrosopumilus sp.]
MKLFGKKDETDPKVILKLRQLSKEGKYEEELRLIEKNFSNKHETYWYNRGNCLYSLKRYDDALKSYLKAIEIDNKYIKAYYRLAQLLFIHDQLEDALQYFDQVVRLETEQKLHEWSSPSIFHMTICRNELYQQTKNEELLQLRDKGVKFIRDHTRFDLDGKDIFDFFLENYGDFLDALEPNIIVDFRVRKHGKTTGSKVLVEEGKVKKEDYGIDEK